MEKIHMSYVDRETRERLNNLSKHVWGAPSAWMKFLDRGIVVEPNEEEKAAVFLIDGKSSGPPYKVKRHYTVETIEALMLDLLKKIQDTNTKKV